MDYLIKEFNIELFLNIKDFLLSKVTKGSCKQTYFNSKIFVC